MEITIQRVVDFDEEFIRSLFESANEKNVSPNPKFLADERNVLLVAYADQQACGMLYAYILMSPHKLRPELFLYSVDTFQHFRKQGVAVKLIESLKDFAKAQGCNEMFVMTNNNNKAAMGLYEKTGGIVGNYDDILFVYELS